MDRDYQVIIVGAGPAGASLAYLLARKKTRVLLLEKETLPRYKCCAGGVSVRTSKLLSFDMNGLAEDVITGATVTFRGGQPYRGFHDQPLIYAVMRDRFDQALVRQAQEAGATILQGQRVTGIEVSDREVGVWTRTGNFRSQYLVGADGAYSVVARGSGLRGNCDHIAAIETEVHIAREEMARWRSQVVVDLGCIRGGYAWVFPKSHHLSIGIACLSPNAKALKQGYREFLDSLKIGSCTVVRQAGSLVPVCRGEAAVARGRVALLGDAAGLVDPLTGEGIHNAILSARLAAPVIEESLLDGGTRLNGYQQAVCEKIMPEIRTARVLSGIFTRFPAMVFGMLNRDRMVWRGCCYLMRGEIDYGTIKQRLGGFKGLYGLLTQRRPAFPPA